MESKLASSVLHLVPPRLTSLSNLDVMGFLFLIPDKYSYIQRLLFCLAFLTTAAMVMRSQRSRPFGRPRLAVALPLVLGNFLVPFLFHWDRDIVSNIISSLVITWLSSFKALGWVLNRGPLVQPLTLLQFVAVYICPITPTRISGLAVPTHKVSFMTTGNQQQQQVGSEVTGGGEGDQSEEKDDTQAKSKESKESKEFKQAKPDESKEFYRSGGRLGESSGGGGANLGNFLAKCAWLALFLWLLMNYRDNMPSMLETFLWAMGLYCLLGMTFDGPAAVLIEAMGLSIAPHFDHPYRATSVAEFWNKRWNLTAGSALRFLVYDTINEGRLVYDPKVAVARSPRRRLLGLAAVFAVSGVMHMFMYGYFGHRLSWRFFAFFASQIPLMVGEALGRKMLRKRGITVPIWIAVPLTIGSVTWCADRFFFAPLHSIDVTSKVARNIAETGRELVGAATLAAELVKGWWGMVGLVKSE